MSVPGNSSLIQTSPIALALVRFLRWWGHELSELLPAGLREWWGGGGQAVLMSIDGGRAHFERRFAGRKETIAEIGLEHNHPEIQGADLKRQFEQQAGKGYQLILSLPAASTLHRRLTLPLATEENLGQTLVFELDRYTPFKSDDVYFDYRVLRRDAARRTLELDLAVVKRSVVDTAKQIMVTWGLPLHGLAFDGEILGGRHVSDWYSPTTGKSSLRLWGRIALGLLAIALLAALLGIPIWQKRAAAIALLQPLAEARKSANETDVMRDRLEKLVAEHNVLLKHKWDSPALLQVLDETSRRLKDDTYVLNFNLDGKTLTLQGDSGSGAELVEILDASPLFHNVVFKSPLTKLQGGTHDRFHISAEISQAGMLKPAVATPGENRAPP